MRLGQICSIISITPAGVMELVDVVDSKSTAGDSVPVRVRSPAPRRCGRHIVRSDFFIKSLLTYSVAAPFKITTASLGCDFVLGTDLGVRASILLRRYTSEQAMYRLLRFFSKVRARSCRCASFSTAIRSAEFAVGYAGLVFNGDLKLHPGNVTTGWLGMTKGTEGAAHFCILRTSAFDTVISGVDTAF